MVSREQREVNPPDWYTGIMIIGPSEAHERNAHSVDDCCLMLLFLFVHYWKTFFLSNIKQNSAWDSKRMNWKKYGRGCGLLQCIFPLFPYKGWVKPRERSDTVFRQKTEPFPKKQNCQLLYKNRMLVYTETMRRKAFSLQKLLVCGKRLFMSSNNL